jgi:transcriptional regulator with XRE-family HTH domain
VEADGQRLPSVFMKLRRVFAENLRRARRAASITQEELADRASIDRTYVSLLERQEYAVSIDVIERIAIALQLEPADFFKAIDVDTPSLRATE